MSWEQVLIPLFWLPGYFIVLHHKRKLPGYIWGVCSFPFSIHSTASHGQWGMLLLESVAAMIWISAGIKHLRNQ